MKGICPSFSPRPPHITPMSKSIISNMKQQFVVTHTIRQNWDSVITRQLGYKRTLC